MMGNFKILFTLPICMEKHTDMMRELKNIII